MRLQCLQKAVVLFHERDIKAFEAVLINEAAANLIAINYPGRIRNNDSDTI
jgi:hypothetical protein